METTYIGLGGLDVETRTRIEHLTRTYVALLGFAMHEVRIQTTIRTRHEHNLVVFTVKLKLKALGTLLAQTKATSTSIHDACKQAANELELLLDRAITRIYRSPYTRSFAHPR